MMLMRIAADIAGMQVAFAFELADTSATSVQNRDTYIDSDIYDNSITNSATWRVRLVRMSRRNHECKK